MQSISSGLANSSRNNWKSRFNNQCNIYGNDGQPDFRSQYQEAKKTALVIDIVYNPLVTELLKEATKLKLKTVGGIGMLINQAVPGFEHWFQKSPVIDDEIRKFIVE